MKGIKFAVQILFGGYKSTSYGSWLEVDSRRYAVFFDDRKVRWEVMLREVFLIIKFKFIWVQAKHAHHTFAAFPLRLDHDCI